MADIGFVYILGNRAMPGIFKVGMTMNAPTRRCLELSASTAIPLPFELLAYGEVENPVQVESQIHDAYTPFRVSPSREFFRAPLESLISTLVENCSSVAVAYDSSEKEFWRGD